VNALCVTFILPITVMMGHDPVPVVLCGSVGNSHRHVGSPHAANAAPRARWAGQDGSGIALEHAGKFVESMASVASAHPSQNPPRSDQHTTSHFIVNHSLSMRELAYFSPAGNPNAPGRQPGQVLNTPDG
jgi:hypothetical protein